MERSGIGIVSICLLANPVVTSLRCLKGSHIPEWQLLEFDRCRWLDADIVRHLRRASVCGNFFAYLKGEIGENFPLKNDRQKFQGRKIILHYFEFKSIFRIKSPYPPFLFHENIHD